MATSQSTRPRRRDREATRAALLEAAAAVFARKGFAAATLDEISEAAGFTRGAFHHHFASKEELFLEVIARHDRELLASYEPVLSGAMPPDPHLNALHWREVHATDQVDNTLRAELRLLALRDDDLRRRVTSVERDATRATAARLKKTAAAHGLRWRYPPEQVATLLHLMSGALRTRSALGEGDTAELMEMFLAVMWEGTLADPSDRQPASPTSRNA
jgi:AcrR family transcriptional regulator